MQMTAEEDMGGGKKQSYVIRRLSTISWVKAQPSHYFTTTWCWYWQDENNKWNRYETANIVERDFEEHFLENPSTTLAFTAGQHNYMLKANGWLNALFIMMI
jgi:hypothetical protein